MTEIVCCWFAFNWNEDGEKLNFALLPLTPVTSRRVFPVFVTVNVVVAVWAVKAGNVMEVDEGVSMMRLISTLNTSLPPFLSETTLKDFNAGLVVLRKTLMVELSWGASVIGVMLADQSGSFERRLVPEIVRQPFPTFLTSIYCVLWAVGKIAGLGVNCIVLFRPDAR